MQNVNSINSAVLLYTCMGNPSPPPRTPPKNKKIKNEKINGVKGIFKPKHMTRNSAMLPVETSYLACAYIMEGGDKGDNSNDWGNHDDELRLIITTIIFKWTVILPCKTYRESYFFFFFSSFFV